MNNRILVNIYDQDLLSGVKKLKYSKLVTTELTATNVAQQLEVGDGFVSHVIEGIVLSFVDFFCIHVSPNDAILKIEQLSTSNKTSSIHLPDKCLLKSEKENNDIALSRRNNELVYTYNRTELGASGFGETIIEFASNHPIAMMFIGGFVWDRVKELKTFLFRKVFRLKSSNNTTDYIVFSVKRFHENFSISLSIKALDFQIIDIYQEERKKYIITIRTVNNKKYKAMAKNNGEIITVEEDLDE